MLERYVLSEQAAAEREFMPARVWWKFDARFNVAARQYVPSVRVHDGQTEGLMVRWGFVPSWAEGKTTGPDALYADMVSIERSKGYRMPWLSGQRCILPASGFYAWQLTRGNYRQPYYLRLINRSVFGIAAVWDRSVGEDDDVIESCTVILVPPNDLMTGIARGLPGMAAAMPAILRRRDYHAWLYGTPVEAKAALHSYQSKWMEAHAVSPRINSTAPDDAGLIQPVA
jgi:putative SOS response-associated peptidase YedK